MDKIFKDAKFWAVVKFTLALVPIGAFIKGIYWIFDKGYLSGLGISPEIFSRPVLESDFIIAWLSAEMVMPIVWGVLAIAACLFVFLYGKPSSSKSADLLLGPASEEQGGEEAEPLVADFNISCKGQAKQKEFGRSSRLMDWVQEVVDKTVKAMIIPFTFVSISILLILIYAVSVVVLHGKAHKVGASQIKQYLSKESRQCTDAFNNNYLGCFHIEGVQGTGHLLILNDDTHLIYFSCSNMSDKSDAMTAPCLEKNLSLKILEKEPGKQYSITRDYRVK